MSGLVRIGVIVILSLILGACSCSDERRHSVEIDREAYDLGAEHGKSVIDCLNDTVELCNRLLDVRTRETDFRNRFGNVTADSYVEGFENYIREHNRALAEELF